MAYAGSRLEAIENRVKALWNDDSGRFYSQTQFLLLANMAQAAMASAGLWVKETAINTVAAQESYDLNALITDLVQAYSARWHGDDYEILPCLSWSHYREFADTWGSTGGDPMYYYIVPPGKLYLTPTPASAVTSAIYVQHSYKPADLTTSAAYTPALPATFDICYVYKLLELLSERQKDTAGADRFRALFDIEFRKAKGALSNQTRAITPYR
jgi:hypothetical protein